MRYKLFNAATGAPLGTLDDVRKAVEFAQLLEANATDLEVAIKDENTGAVL